MSETATVNTPAANDKPTAVKIGAPVRAELPQAAPVASTDDTPDPTTTAPTASTEGSPAPAAPAPADPTTATGSTSPSGNTDTEPSEEAIKAYFEKQGIQYDGIEKLKEKLNEPAAPVALTEEQKIAQAKAFEKKMLEEHIARSQETKSPAEAAANFASWQKLIDTDSKIIGFNKVVEDLVNDGMEAKKAIEVANEMYFQKTDEEIEEIIDEDEKKIAIEKRDIGSKKLEKKGANLKKTVSDYFNDTRESIAEQDAEKSKMEKHTANVADAIGKFQRKQPIKLGQRNEVDLAPVDFEVPEEALTRAKEYIGSDPKTLHDKLFTNSGEVNIAELLPILVNHFAYEQAAKTGFFEGENRTTAAFEARFSSTPPPLGGNGRQQQGAGKVVKAGTPVYAKRP